MNTNQTYKRGFSSLRPMHYVNSVKTGFRRSVTEIWLQPLEERLQIFHPTASQE